MVRTTYNNNNHIKTQTNTDKTGKKQNWKMRTRAQKKAAECLQSFSHWITFTFHLILSVWVVFFLLYSVFVCYVHSNPWMHVQQRISEILISAIEPEEHGGSLFVTDANKNKWEPQQKQNVKKQRFISQHVYQRKQKLKS